MRAKSDLKILRKRGGGKKCLLWGWRHRVGLAVSTPTRRTTRDLCSCPDENGSLQKGPVTATIKGNPHEGVCQVRAVPLRSRLLVYIIAGPRVGIGGLKLTQGIWKNFPHDGQVRRWRLWFPAGSKDAGRDSSTEAGSRRIAPVGKKQPSVGYHLRFLQTE